MHRLATRLLGLTLLGAALCAPALGAGNVAYLRLKGEVPERERMASPLFSLKEGPSTLREIVEAIDDAAKPSRQVDGLVIRTTELGLNSSQIDEVGAALKRFRAAGKKVHFFTEIYGPAELALASYADEVLMQSGGAVSLPGLYMEEMFLADALRTVGVTPDFVQIGDYKGAQEMYANSRPSPQWDQNINQLLDSLFERSVDRIAAGRGLTREQVEEAMEHCFLADGALAKKFHLIDDSIDRLDLEARLETLYGKDFTWDPELSPQERDGADIASMGFFEAFSQFMKMLEQSAAAPSRETIAIVHIDGAIMDGESSGGGFLSEPTVGSLTIRKTLAELEDDALIKGVIVRINSPGGSAIASDSIWLGVRRLAKTKPVWVSVGSMAASGGYYIAVAGQKIYVTPSSIVGSIGVVGGKLALQGLYDKLHINVVARSRGPMASVMGALAPWSEKERDLVRARMQETYNLFVSRVTAGRPSINIAQTAEGRLFAGQKALEMKMADQIGGLSMAISDLATSLGLHEGAFDVVDYPAPKSFEEMLQDMLPMAQAGRAVSLPDLPSLQALRALVGPGAWSQLQRALQGAMLLRREPVVLVTPSVLIVK